jgi:hypothetical protein
MTATKAAFLKGVVCQKRRHYRERAVTKKKAKHLQPKPESLFARRCTTFGRGNMALAPPNKPSQLDCPRPGALA